MEGLYRVGPTVLTYVHICSHLVGVHMSLTCGDRHLLEHKWPVRELTLLTCCRIRACTSILYWYGLMLGVSYTVGNVSEQLETCWTTVVGLIQDEYSTWKEDDFTKEKNCCKFRSIVGHTADRMNRLTKRVQRNEMGINVSTIKSTHSHNCFNPLITRCYGYKKALAQIRVRTTYLYVPFSRALHSLLVLARSHSYSYVDKLIHLALTSTHSWYPIRTFNTRSNHLPSLYLQNSTSSSHLISPNKMQLIHLTTYFTLSLHDWI